MAGRGAEQELQKCLLLQLGLPAARWLRQAFAGGTLTKQLSRQLGQRGMQAVVLAAVAWKALRLRAQQREPAPAAGSTASGSTGRQGERQQGPPELSAPKPLCPTTFELLANPGESGYADLASVVAIWIVGSVVMERKALVLGRLFASQADVLPPALWMRRAWELPLLCALHALLVDAAAYVQARMALHWRQNVTEKLHDMYFARMAYYRIHNDAKEPAISDPEVRICRDVRDMVNGNAELAVTLTEALVKTCFFGGLAVVYGRWLWALSAPMFFFMSLKAILRMEPHQGSHIQITLQHVEGKFKRHLVRLQAHAESVCMLQGEAFELDLMQKAVFDISHLAKQRCHVMFLMQLAECAFFRTPQAATFLELAAHFAAACLGAGQPASLAGDSGRCSVGEHLGGQIRGVHSFVHACASWKAFVGARSQLLNCSYATNRVKQLYVRLERLQGPAPLMPGRRRKKSKEAGPAEEQHISDGGPVISFQGVTIQTPAKEALVRNLTFSVAEGQPLLICGHGGAGKSAIARSLCLLWPPGGGQILRPGGCARAEDGAPLRGEVYYLPQIPYNALGSLSDQLTYPAVLPGGLPKEDLRCWLRHVGLERLLDRPHRTEGALCAPMNDKDAGDAVDWGACLSLQEQQAFGFARLLYHRPRFAVLDDCASALDADFQARLYSLARELGITYITISRRPTLQDHHARLLSLSGCPSEPSGGWSFTETASAHGAPHMRSRCRTAAEAHARLEEIAAGCGKASSAAAPPPGESAGSWTGPTAERTESSSCDANELMQRRWPTCASRLWAVLRMSLQASHRRHSAWRRLAVMLVALQARTSLFWLFCRSLCGMARASAVGDLPLVIAECLANCLVVCLGGAADQLLRHQAGQLSIELWTGAMNSLQRRLLRSAALCRVLCPVPGPSPTGRAVACPTRPAVDEPILRLLEVRGLFDALGSQLCDTLVPLATLIFLLPAATRGMGLCAPLLVFVHCLLLRVCQLLGPDLAALHGRTARLEACFQALHGRLRASAEAVAASSGGATERSLVEPRFQALLEHLAEVRRKELLRRALASFAFDYRQLPCCLLRLVCLRFSSQGDRSLCPLDSACVGLLLDRLLQAPQIAVQHLVKSAEGAARADVQCRRYLELLVACELAGKTRAAPLAVSCNAERLEVRGLDLRGREGELLAEGLDFKVEAGTPLLVTGPSCSGKSLLAGALLGLRAGQPRPPLRSLMASPQRPYLPAGCRLLAQLAYPTVLRLPSREPFRAYLTQLPNEEGLQERVLREHFERLGGLLTPSLQGARPGAVRSGVIVFKAFDDLLRAVAKPQERVVEGTQLELEFIEPQGAPPAPPVVGDSAPRLARARQSLRSAGLEGVLAREPEGWFARRAWEEVLSGSEQQQLCIARVLYHGPTFAVLDESASLLPERAERGQHEELLKSWGVTPLALTRHAALPDLYARELRLPPAGRPSAWSLRESRPRPPPTRGAEAAVGQADEASNPAG